MQRNTFPASCKLTYFIKSLSLTKLFLFSGSHSLYDLKHAYMDDSPGETKPISGNAAKDHFCKFFI